MIGIGPRLCMSSFCRYKIIPYQKLPFGIESLIKTSISNSHPSRSSLRHFSSFTKAVCKRTCVSLKIRQVLIRTKTEDAKFDAYKTLQGFRIHDQIPKYYEMIYRSNFGNYLISLQLLHFLILGAVISVISIKSLEMLFPFSEENIQAEIKLAKKYNTIPAGETEQDMLTRLRNPHFEQILEGGLPVLSFFIGSLLLSIYLLNRYQRCLPIRIYTSSKGHSIAIMYGHILPLRTTRYEFMAGGLKLQPNPRNTLWSISNYKDVTGQKLILMEHFFRYPADLHRLCGTQKDSGEWDKEYEHEPNAPYPNLPDDPSLSSPSPPSTSKPKQYK